MSSKSITISIIGGLFLLFIVLMLIQAFLPSPNVALITLAAVILLTAFVVFVNADEITRFLEKDS